VSDRQQLESDKGVSMEKDIVLTALHRFQEIVVKGQLQSHAAGPSLEADLRLVRLAIKKYSRALEWRSRIPRTYPNGSNLWS
jgi:hypothetical protein